MNIEELIARLEKATGPDRELDVDIAIACPGRWPRRRSNARGKYVTTYEDGRTGVANSLDYTRHIDAALTLVPKGCSWEMDCWPTGRAKFHASCGGGVRMGLSNANPAIALCIAALKAQKGTE